MAVWRRGLVLLKFVNFFCREQHQVGHGECFHLLGINFDRGGKKAPPYIAARAMRGLLEQSKILIFELEIAPILVSLGIWKHPLHGAHVICFLDNDGARHKCIHCYARLEPANSWIESIITLEASMHLKPWYARMGTSSNIADGPSLDLSAKCLRGVVRARPSLDSVLKGCG